MKAILAMLAAALLTAGTDYAKLLDEAKITLGDAVARGLKEAGDGAAVKAELEQEGGKTIFSVEIARGAKVEELHLAAADGAVVGKETEDEDKSALVKSFRITLAQAVESALKKTAGRAVHARLGTKGKAAEARVKIWDGAKLLVVSVDGTQGTVLRVEEAKPGRGYLGLKGEDAAGGVKVTALVKDMPATKAGLKEGDLLTSINGKKVATLKEVAAIVAPLGEGAEAKIEYTRDGKSATLTLKLAGDDDDDDDEDDDEDDDDDEDGDDD